MEPHTTISATRHPCPTLSSGMEAPPHTHTHTEGSPLEDGNNTADVTMAPKPSPIPFLAIKWGYDFKI